MTKITMDHDAATTFGEAAASIATSALSGLSPEALAGVNARLQAGGNLYLHVQLVPTFVVVLALDPGANVPTLELARWEGETPAGVKLN